MERKKGKKEQAYSIQFDFDEFYLNITAIIDVYHDKNPTA